jgi:hypothetical protein
MQVIDFKGFFWGIKTVISDQTMLLTSCFFLFTNMAFNLRPFFLQTFNKAFYNAFKQLKRNLYVI